jgi:hypothetical protein
MNIESSQAGAGNCAVTSSSHIGHRSRAVPDQRRSGDTVRHESTNGPNQCEKTLLL